MSDENGSPRWFVGGYLDDSISDDRVDSIKEYLTSTLGSEIDAETFMSWLRRELANYRNIKEINDKFPGISQDHKYANSLGDKISALLHDLEQMPPNLATLVDSDLLQQGHDESSVANRSLIRGVTSGLMELQFSLLRVESELAHTPGPGRGRKKNTHRDLFLAKVKDELLAIGAPKSKAPAVAAKILIGCGVEAPNEGRSRPEKRLGKN